MMLPIRPCGEKQEHFGLHGDDVHVWLACLDSSFRSLPQLGDSLSLDERRRAARFHFERDRRRFVAGRGVLRAILGEYLETEPKQIAFGYGPNGKPSLAPAVGLRLRFNVSHSQNLALFAITKVGAVGIDLEAIRPIADAEQIALSLFSPWENECLQTLPEVERLEGFFNCWTRKEAYVKARGEGLSRALDDFDVTLTPGDPVRLVSVRGDPSQPSRWSLSGLSPVDGYAAALAVEGHGRRVISRSWRDAELG